MLLVEAVALRQYTASFLQEIHLPDVSGIQRHWLLLVD